MSSARGARNPDPPAFLSLRPLKAQGIDYRRLRSFRVILKGDLGVMGDDKTDEEVGRSADSGIVSAISEELQVLGPPYRLYPRPYIQLIEDVSVVGLDGVEGDTLPRGDLFVLETGCNQPEHGDLP